MSFFRNRSLCGQMTRYVARHSNPWPWPGQFDHSFPEMDRVVEDTRKAIAAAFAGAKPVPAKLKRKPTMRDSQDRHLALQCLSLSLDRSASSGGYETSVVIEEAAEFFAFVTGEPTKSVREQIEGLLDTAEVK